jgi:hypothetical protein
MRCTLIALLLLFAMFPAGGCQESDDGRVPVAGHVFIDGEPLTSGTIRFVPTSGRPTSSAILADGSFELASESVHSGTAVGVPCGKYRVQVSASEVVDDATIHWNVPARYADFRTSGLDVTISEPMDDLKIELTWEGEKRSRGRGAAAGADDPTVNPRSLPSSDASEDGKNS